VQQKHTVRAQLRRLPSASIVEDKSHPEFSGVTETRRNSPPNPLSWRKDP
jgi:hypothetical protein